jgi:hypothetical protein
MFIDANRRRDDCGHHDGEVRPRRGVVRTTPFAPRPQLAARSAHQAVELSGVLADHLSGDLGRQVRELLGDIFP